MYKKVIRTTLLLAGIVSLSAAGNAFAHHSFGMFDMTKSVTVTGVVKSFQWTNPHVWIDIVTKGPGEKQGAPYSVEAGSVSILEKQGWTRTSLKPGDEVTLVAHPLRGGAVGGSLVSATVNGTLIGRPEPE